MIMAIDAKLVSLINQCGAHPVLDVLMPLATEIGSGEGIFILSFLPLFLAKRGNRKAAYLLWAGLTVAYYVSSVLKGLVARPRPFMALPDVRAFGVEKSFSFPSTHAMQSFMAATVLSGFFKGRVVYFTLAAAVAYSRVYMGFHYVSDVLVGAVLGTFIGYVLVRLGKNP